MKLLDSATIHGPLGLVQGGGGVRWTAFPVRFGLIEPRGILVDTGYGHRVTRGRRSAMLRAYAAILRPRLSPTPMPSVDTVLLTHLHADHVARLRDMPAARILASREAVEAFAAMTPRQAARHAVFAELLPDDLATRAVAVETLPRVATGTALGEGFDLVGDGSHLAIPLPGHAPGHLGVFWRDRGQPTLYATDAAWTLTALRAGSTPGLARALIFHDRAAAAETETRILAFAGEGGRVLLCHDPRPIAG